MKKIFLLLFIIGYFLFDGFLVGEVFAEKINDFSVEIKINKDGTTDVKETIVYDFGNLERHGFFREIPFIKKNEQGKKFALEFKNFSVVDEKGKPYPFNQSKKGENIRLKIGDPNKTITGVNTYTLSYKVIGALTYFSDHDELYWNITGNDWPVSINSVTATVYLPEKTEEKNLRTKCFTGGFGSTLSECQVYIEKDGEKIIFQATRSLSLKEGLTVVVGFPKGLVSVLEPKEYKSFWETLIGKLIILLLGFLALIWYLVLPIYIIYRWFKYGRDPKPTDLGEVRAWFDPPKTPDGKRFLTPAEVGVLGDERVDLKDISATIVDLARRDYLRIEERKKGEFWLVENKKQQKNQLLPFERLLLDQFFKNSTEINLKKTYLYDEVEKVKEAIYNEAVKVGFFSKNPYWVRMKMKGLTLFSFITGNVFLFIVALTFGRHLPQKTVEGVKAKLVAFSLRNFLKSQKTQLTFQADRQMLFERLLPYAIVFGVEKIWAKRFEDLGVPLIKWYSSYSSFSNSTDFVDSLNASFSGFQQAAGSTVSSSGFSSGFSGGSSGGGGGGGGGGSW